MVKRLANVIHHNGLFLASGIVHCMAQSRMHPVSPAPWNTSLDGMWEPIFRGSPEELGHDGCTKSPTDTGDGQGSKATGPLRDEDGAGFTPASRNHARLPHRVPEASKEIPPFKGHAQEMGRGPAVSGTSFLLHAFRDTLETSRSESGKFSSGDVHAVFWQDTKRGVQAPLMLSKIPLKIITRLRSQNVIGWMLHIPQSRPFACQLLNTVSGMQRATRQQLSWQQRRSSGLVLLLPNPAPLSWYVLGDSGLKIADDVLPTQPAASSSAWYWES
jgi:hypothetical protein